MTTATKPKQTWRDWMPDVAPEPELLTRDELIDALADDGVSVNYRNLEHWQALGVIPYPVRMRHEGATRAMYPTWMVGAVKHVRDAQGRGMALEKIAPIVRSYAWRDVQFVDPLAKPRAELRAAFQAFIRAWEQSDRSHPTVEGVAFQLTDGSGEHVLYEDDFPVVPTGERQ